MQNALGAGGEEWALSKGQGKREGISSHEDASPGMFTAHMEESLNTFLY